MTYQHSGTDCFNDENIHWFGNMDVREMVDFGVSTGLESRKADERPRDLEIVVPLLAANGCERLLEIGAGYGRVVDSFLEAGIREIRAVEPTPNFADHLRRRYAGMEDVVVAQESILESAETGDWDACTLMWGSITQFSREEQRLTFKKVQGLLAEGGLFLMETPSTESQTNASRAGETVTAKSGSWETRHGTYVYYIPDHEELLDYAAAAGLELAEKVEYDTAKSAGRLIYAFRKPRVN